MKVLLLGLRQHLQPDVIASHLTVIGRPICTIALAWFHALNRCSRLRHA